MAAVSMQMGDEIEFPLVAEQYRLPGQVELNDHSLTPWHRLHGAADSPWGSSVEAFMGAAG